MAKTVLQLITAACQRSAYPCPTTLVSNTEDRATQLLALFYEIGEDLREKRYWEALKRRHYFALEQARSQYPLPLDFLSPIGGTYWDNANHWRMRGPMNDIDFNMRARGFITYENRKGFRIFGPDAHAVTDLGQVELYPPPGANSGGEIVTYEYITRSWLTPPLWTPATVLALNSYVLGSGGAVYKVTTSGTSGTYPPNMKAGRGQEGGTFWSYIPRTAWAGSTTYAQGEYVTNGGTTYVCTTSGVSASVGGPSGTGTGIVDNRCEWSSISSSAWTAEFVYSLGAFVTVSSNLYKNTSDVARIGGKIGPVWTATTVTDNSAVLTWQPAPYEAALSDNDLCLFDDDLMILGMRWKIAEAKGFDGAAFQAAYEKKKLSLFNKANVGMRLSLGSEGPIRGFIIPEGNFG